MYFWIFVSVVGAIAPFFSHNTHGFLGESSDNYLKEHEPIIYNKILGVLNNQTISNVSSWADSVKRTKEYAWTRTLHYIDIMECRKEKYDRKTIEKYCENKCIVSALVSFVEELRTRQTSKTCVKGFGNPLSDEDLLKFIIHFMEDFSEPMHLLGYQRGGNSLNLQIKMPNGKIRKMNLHQVWDALIPDFYIKTFKPLFTFTVKKPKNYNLLVDKHLNMNIGIACLIYPNNETIVFDEYFNKDFMDTLFKNYHEMSVSTFKYIFEV